MWGVLLLVGKYMDVKHFVIDAQLLLAINMSLDREREVQLLANDRELARHLGISPKTLSFWRHGRHLPKSTIIFVRLLIRAQEDESNADQST